MQNMTYPEALDWLYGCQKIGIKLGLSNTQRLLQTMELSTKGRYVFHVAGTNGKGSVCAFLESICRQAGYRTGMFTSPHLVSFTERTRINGTPVSEEWMAREISQIRELVKDWDPHPTFFELNTALGQKCFRDAKVDVIILETGLGGRLDSTNAVRSDLSIITPIGMDHQEYLGNDLATIAVEKAGIIKSGKPVVTGCQAPQAEAVIRDVAQRQESPYHLVTAPFPDTTPLGLFGAHQFWNAALAVQAIQACSLNIPDIAIAEGLAQTSWPARFQELPTATGPVIIDGAHNPPAAAILVEAWRARFGEQKAAIVFGAVRDKDIRGIAETLQAIAGQWFPTSTPTHRGCSPEEVMELAGIKEASPHAKVADAIQAAQASGLPVLVAGSIFLAGEALNALGWSEGRFEPSAM